MSSLPLSPQVFTILAALVETHAGLHYSPEDRELVADRVSTMALEEGFDSVLDYYYYLRYDPAGPAALERLVEALVVHETYFFREADALRALVSRVLAPRAAERNGGRGERLRVWSAASATGEEPLTLAMLLDEAGLLPRVQLVASDYSRRALERAARAEYGARALRALPPGVEGRWLAREGERVRVRRDLVQAVDWRRVNLVDAGSVRELGVFDAIVCRNVLIYFSDETARQVVESLTRSLVPGGYLLVGTSESLTRLGTALECEERGGTFFYRKA